MTFSLQNQFGNEFWAYYYSCLFREYSQEFHHVLWSLTHLAGMMTNEQDTSQGRTAVLLKIWSQIPYNLQHLYCILKNLNQ